MPTQNADVQKVEQMRKEAAARNKQASSYGASATTLSDTVMNAVREDRQQRGVSQMATDVGNVMGQMATEPQAIKGRAGDIMNPMDVDQFTAQARGQQLRTLGTLATKESENYGTLQEIIQAGANQLVARGQLEMAKAEELVAKAGALMQRLSFEEEQKQFNQRFEEDKSQFDEQMDLSRQKEARVGSGSAKEPKETRPLYTPMTGDGTVSDGGTYIFYVGQWLSPDDLNMMAGLTKLMETKSKLTEKDTDLTNPNFWNKK
jgi:hypothetical protein